MFQKKLKVDVPRNQKGYVLKANLPRKLKVDVPRRLKMNVPRKVNDDIPRELIG